jgi:hypothetical protein
VTLDCALTECDNLYTMSTRKLPESMTDVLRRTISESRMPYKALSRETGVARASIQRFVDGRQSIRLDMADRLAAYFGVFVVVKPRPRRTQGDQ